MALIGEKALYFQSSCVWFSNKPAASGKECIKEVGMSDGDDSHTSLTRILLLMILGQIHTIQRIKFQKSRVESQERSMSTRAGWYLKKALQYDIGFKFHDITKYRDSAISIIL